MQLVLACPSGIAGNLWLAALLGLGADAGVLTGLPERLGVPAARIDWRYDPDGGRSEVDVHGTGSAPPTDYAGLVARVHDAGLPAPARDDALAVLHRRETAEARFLGLDLATRSFCGDDVADTLIDVVGGVLLWHALDGPATTTAGPVVAGIRPRTSSLELLGGVPVEHGGADLCLTTPTGAALLRAFWQSGPLSGPPVREVHVPSEFSTVAGLPPLRATLHDRTAEVRTQR